MKDFVTLHAVYYICVDSAVLHVLPYVFELTAVGFAYKLCKLPRGVKIGGSYLVMNVGLECTRIGSCRGHSGLGETR
jgi:hypothetical protein